MMDDMREKKINNKGFSLVELLVTFAILSIVSGTIIGIMASGMRFFRTNTTTVGLQYEYQVVMTQLREYIVDCNAGIASEGSTLYIVNKEEYRDSDDNIITEYTTHVFVLDVPNLYYIRSGTPSVGIPVSISTTANRNLMSERVNAFGADITNDEETGRTSVITTMQFTNGTRVYRAPQTIALRNPVVWAPSYTLLREALNVLPEEAPPTEP